MEFTARLKGGAGAGIVSRVVDLKEGSQVGGHLTAYLGQFSTTRNKRIFARPLAIGGEQIAIGLDVRPRLRFAGCLASTRHEVRDRVTQWSRDIIEEPETRCHRPLCLDALMATASPLGGLVKA